MSGDEVNAGAVAFSRRGALGEFEDAVILKAFGNCSACLAMFVADPAFVELANRESRSNWRDFLLGFRKRGLTGVEFVVSDDHAGLKAAIREVLPETVWQRCYVHFLRNALDYVPREVGDDCLRELRWF
jgi:hypothetical protein